MTIDELIEKLQELKFELNGDTEILLMTQERRPLTHDIHGIVSGEEINKYWEEEEGNKEKEEEESINNNTLYIIQGDDVGYGSKDAWDATQQ